MQTVQWRYKKGLNELRHPFILFLLVFDSKVIDRFVHLDLTLTGEKRKRVSNYVKVKTMIPCLVLYPYYI